MHSDRDFFTEALVTYIARQRGLVAVYLPIGIDRRIAEGIVEAANRIQIRADGTPYAILVERVPSDSPVSVSVAEAIKYRKGNRLVVVMANSSDLESFSGVYRRVIGPEFPANSPDVLRELSSILVNLISEEMGLALRSTVQSEDSMYYAMRLSVETLRNSDDPRGNWSSRWYQIASKAVFHLCETLEHLNELRISSPIEEQLRKSSLAAFGLPQSPVILDEGAIGRKGKKYCQALSLYWGSEEASDSSKEHIARQRKGISFAELSWEGLDDRITKFSSIYPAFQEQVCSTSLAEYELIREHEFLNPNPRDATDVGVLDSDGKSLSVSTASGALNVVRTETLSGENGVRTEDLDLVVPIGGDPAESELRTEIPLPADFIGERTIEQGELHFRGYFKIKGVRPKRRPIRKRTNVEVSPKDPLAGLVGKPIIDFILLPPDTPSVLVFEHQSSERIKQTFNFMPANALSPELVESVSLLPRSQHLVIAYGDRPSGDSAHRFTEVSGRHDLYSCLVMAGESLEFSLRDQHFELTPEENATSVYSSLLAAAMGASISSDPLPESVLKTDIRAAYEDYIVDQDLEFGAAFGHVISPESEDTDLPMSDPEFLNSDTGPAKFTWKESRSLEPVSNIHSFQRHLLGQEADDFDAAAKAIIGVFRGMDTQDEPKLWPSRRTHFQFWREHRQELEEYLLAYCNLVEAAQALPGRRTRFTSFLALYPFSISVWKGSECSGVLLSPLHPIRLACMAATESLLEDATEAEDFLGTIETWQYPYLGARETLDGTLISIPIDSGFRDIFSGWAMLVPLDERLADLRKPESVAGLEVPGGSTSGLTGSAVVSALRDFMRVNPFVSNLSIDLASGEPVERNSSVDRELVEFLKSDQSILDGIRGVNIFDSTNRGGEIPVKYLASQGKSDHRVRFTWSRYSMNDGNPQSMLRIQQDSLMEVGAVISEEPNTRCGILSPDLLRRFQAEQPHLAENAVQIHPHLSGLSGDHQEGLFRAISILEGTSPASALDIRPKNLTSVSDSTWWTVSGESLAYPGAIQEALDSGINSQDMIWEWRPPHFERLKERSQLSRRAYLTVARVPLTLQTRIQDRLSRMHGDFRAEDILAKLGASGIGLASLVSIGGHQASGAIGFYLALKLMETHQDPDVTRIVIPIDACQRFLDLLSGDDQDGSKHRADLLVIDLSGPNIRITPCEVKMFGLESPRVRSSSMDSPEIKDAVDQVLTSRNQLESMLAKRSQMKTDSDRALWDNAFSALIETGIRILPSRSAMKNLVPSLEAAVRGRASITIGDGTVLAFTETIEAERFRIVRTEDDVFVVRVSPIETGSPDFLLRWRELNDMDLASMYATSARTRGDDQPVSLTDFPLENSSDRQRDDSLLGLNLESKSRILAVDAEGAVSDLVDALEQTGESREENGRDRRELLLDEPVSDVENLADHHDAAPIALTSTGSQVLRRPGVRFPVGNYAYSIGQALPELWLGSTDLNQLNIGIVGDLGTGKTQLVKYLIARIRESSRDCQDSPANFLIFDYKHDYNTVEFLEAVGGDVLRPYKIPLNFFALNDPSDRRERSNRINAFIDVISKIYSGIGPRQKIHLKEVIRDLYGVDGKRPPTLKAILEQYRELHGIDSVVSVLDNFVDLEIFDDANQNAISFPELIEGRVLVIDLADLGSQRDAQNALVTLMLNLYLEYMLGLEKHDFLEGEPSIRYIASYVVVDEATNILEYEFPVLKELLLKGREFGVGVMLSTQYLSHFRTKSEDWSEPLRTWFIHRVPRSTSRELENLGLKVSQEEASQISHYKVHHALFQSLDGRPREIRGTPFFEIRGDLLNRDLWRNEGRE